MIFGKETISFVMFSTIIDSFFELQQYYSDPDYYPPRIYYTFIMTAVIYIVIIAHYLLSVRYLAIEARFGTVMTVLLSVGLVERAVGFYAEIDDVFIFIM